MLTLLGSTGYIGQAFAAELKRRQLPFEALSRSRLDYTNFEVFLGYLRRAQPGFVINAAGYTGKPNVDACETARADTLQGNTLFPAMLAHACAAAGIPWGHVSSGCIYSGAKVVQAGVERTEPDLTKPELRALYREGIPLTTPPLQRSSFHDSLPRPPHGGEGRGEGAAPAEEALSPIPPFQHSTAPTGPFFRGFTETDAPNFTFRSPPCSFYSGTKALGEEAIAGVGQAYIWRLRIPFDEFDNARNYLSKVQRYAKVYDNVNSISHRRDFVAACLDTWQQRVPFGTYNITNPGAVTTRQVVEAIERVLKPARPFEFWESDEEFYKVAAKTPRSNCIMDTTKLLATGIKIRSVEEALEDSLRNWQPEAR
jgi:dTDP-4-dehydrorhamnose reductase